MKGLGKLTCELPSINILNEVTLEHQYTNSMEKNIVNIHTYVFIYLFVLFYFFFTCAYSKYQQMSSTKNT